MTNARKGYKRVMGEIPEELHEKIMLFNKISDRPLNVSKSIEQCITRAWEKIEKELFEEPLDEDGPINIDSTAIYTTIKKDLEEGKLSPSEIYKHFIKLLKKEGLFDNINIRHMLYPIDRVQHAGEKQDYVAIIFLSQNINCFALFPNNTCDD